MLSADGTTVTGALPDGNNNSANGSSIQARIKMATLTYSKGQNIAVNHSGLPGNTGDWIYLFKLGREMGITLTLPTGISPGMIKSISVASRQAAMGSKCMSMTAAALRARQDSRCDDA